MLVEQGREAPVPVWLCEQCYRETEKLKPYLKTWVPMAVILLVLGLGLLVIEVLAAGIVDLLTRL